MVKRDVRKNKQEQVGLVGGHGTLAGTILVVTCWWSLNRISGNGGHYIEQWALFRIYYVHSSITKRHRASMGKKRTSMTLQPMRNHRYSCMVCSNWNQRLIHTLCCVGSWTVCQSCL